MKIIIEGREYSIVFCYDKVKDHRGKIISYGDWAKCIIFDAQSKEKLVEAVVRRYHTDSVDKIKARNFAFSKAVRSLTTNKQIRREFYIKAGMALRAPILN